MATATALDNRKYLDDLKRRVGKQPFIDADLRVGKQPCPFHGGDAGFTLYEQDGVWLGTCHSQCKKTWDAIAFVQQKYSFDFKAAIAHLGGRTGNKPDAAPAQDKPKPKEMTEAQWQQWGHVITAEELALFAASRKDKTAGLDTFRAMGVRVKDGLLGFPYRLRLLPSGDSKYFTIKTRALSAKDIQQEHCVNSKALFNLDTVSCLEPVYVVEGEPDVAVMEEAGFRTVSVMNANHDKFDKAQLDILCEAPHVYLMGDQPQRGLDDPGTHCMDALERQLPVGKVSRIRGTGAKDACELARQWQDGFAARVSELSEDARVPWVSKNIGNVTGLLSLPEPNWVVDRMLPYGCVSILCSPQGGQKTTFALSLSRAVTNPIAFDFKFLGRDIMPHARRKVGDGAYAGSPDVPVLYIDRENPKEMIGSRLRRMGMVASSNFLYWGDGDPDPTKDTPEVTDRRLEEWMKRTGGLIVFDSLQDWYGDAKEIDNTAMVKLMHGFRRLARLGAGVVILHHVAKATNITDMKTFYRGGTGIVSIPEMAIGLIKDEDSGLLRLGEIRFRMCPTWEMTAKLDWEAEDGRGGHGIALYVEEDLDWKALAERRSDHKDEKAAGKASGLDAEARRLETEVIKDPASPYGNWKH